MKLEIRWIFFMKLEIRKRGFMFPLHYIYFIFYITFYVLTSHFLRFYIPYKPTALTFKSDWEKKKNQSYIYEKLMLENVWLWTYSKGKLMLTKATLAPSPFLTKEQIPLMSRIKNEWFWIFLKFAQYSQLPLANKNTEHIRKFLLVKILCIFYWHLP